MGSDLWEPVRLIDGGGDPVAPVTAFLPELQASGRSAATVVCDGPAASSDDGAAAARRSTTQLYLTPMPGDVITEVLTHHRRVEQLGSRPVTCPTPSLAARPAIFTWVALTEQPY